MTNKRLRHKLSILAGTREEDLPSIYNSALALGDPTIRRKHPHPHDNWEHPVHDRTPRQRALARQARIQRRLSD